ncbi:MAG: hypothetical protein ACOYKQ_02305 [Polymorphobacter sp.]
MSGPLKPAAASAGRKNEGRDAAKGARLVTQGDTLIEQQSSVNFLLFDNLLLSLRLVLDETGLDLTEFLIYGTVLAANRQRGARVGGGADAPEYLIPISQSAISRATGLPRETVRRKVGALHLRGILLVIDSGCIVTEAAGSRRSGLLLQLSAVFARTINSLIDLGAILPEAPAGIAASNGHGRNA